MDNIGARMEMDTLSISVDRTLFDQMDVLAHQLQVAPERLMEMAIGYFLRAYRLDSDEPASRPVIKQGDLYWVLLPDLESSISHPHVVLQPDVLNQSRIPTVVVGALTTNLRQINAPGNVLLEIGEANLPKRSIVEVSKVSTIAKTQLGDYIGSLSEQRIQQIFAGMQFLQRSFFSR